MDYITRSDLHLNVYLPARLLTYPVYVLGMTQRPPQAVQHITAGIYQLQKQHNMEMCQSL